MKEEEQRWEELGNGMKRQPVVRRGAGCGEPLQSLILKHFQEQRREEFCGALHLHVQEAAGVAGSDHSQVCHFHQQFWPKVRNMVFSVINVVFERQEETLLTLFYPLNANKAWAICRYKQAELSLLLIYLSEFLIINQEN